MSSSSRYVQKPLVRPKIVARSRDTCGWCRWFVYFANAAVEIASHTAPIRRGVGATCYGAKIRHRFVPGLDRKSNRQSWRPSLWYRTVSVSTPGGGGRGQCLCKPWQRQQQTLYQASPSPQSTSNPVYRFLTTEFLFFFSGSGSQSNFATKCKPSWVEFKT